MLRTIKFAVFKSIIKIGEFYQRRPFVGNTAGFKKAIRNCDFYKIEIFIFQSGHLQHVQGKNKNFSGTTSKPNRRLTGHFVMFPSVSIIYTMTIHRHRTELPANSISGLVVRWSRLTCRAVWKVITVTAHASSWVW